MIGCDKERFKSIVEDQVRIAMIFYPGHDGDDDGDDDVDDDDDDDDDGHGHDAHLHATAASSWSHP